MRGQVLVHQFVQEAAGAGIKPLGGPGNARIRAHPGRDHLQGVAEGVTGNGNEHDAGITHAGFQYTGDRERIRKPPALCGIGQGHKRPDGFNRPAQPSQRETFGRRNV